jgi:flagellar basal-body rod protein FlgB
MIRNLTESLDFNAQALLLRSERSRVLAGNIANADTPGFKAKDFHFGQALAQATGAAERPVTALRTHSSHLAPAGGTLATNMLYRTPMQTTASSWTSNGPVLPRTPCGRRPVCASSMARSAR